MSFFEELSTTVKATLYERLASPLLGSFIVAWLVFNWKAILILSFSDSSMFSRLVVIEANYINIWDNLYLPLLYAAVFSIVYPAISVIPFWFWEFFSSLKLKIKRKISLEQTLTIAQSVELRDELERSHENYKKALDQIRNKELSLENQLSGMKEKALHDATEIEDLRKEVDELNIEKSRLNTSNKALESKLDEKVIDFTDVDANAFVSLLLDRIRLRDEGSFSLHSLLPEVISDALSEESYRMADLCLKERINDGEVIAVKVINGNKQPYTFEKSRSFMKWHNDENGETKEKILKLLSQFGSLEAPMNKVVSSLSLNNLRASIVSDELKDSGLISVKHTNNQGKVIRLTDKGKDYLLEKKLI